MSAISPVSNSISTIIRSFKSDVSKNAHQLKLSLVWQTRFYDHVIRNYQEFIIVETQCFASQQLQTTSVELNINETMPMKKWRKVVGKLEGERTAILIEDNGLPHNLTYPLASYGGVPDND